ncbi:hypothetical protein [Luteolibacter sp. Populi]|uniref:hypothetical protein n=1 Tax=Luteolibacter sp. Populi TaxID=3230487 RepID=UPI0034679FF7
MMEPISSPHHPRFLAPKLSYLSGWCTLLLAALSTSCGLVEKHHLVGSYYLVAEDAPQQMKVVFNLNPGERQSYLRIGEMVYAVGWDHNYIVAKQHPENNRRIDHYYYLDIKKDYESAAPRSSVVGPLTELEFKRRQADLGLPGFRLTIESLQ